MIAKTRKRRSEPESFKTSWSAYVGRGIMTLFLVVFIFYLALLAASRTQGFRSLIAERLEAFTGMEVDVQHSRLSPFLRLTVEDISALMNENHAVPSLAIKELAIRWKPFHLFSSGSEHVVSVKATGVTVDIQREGQVLPACLRPVAKASVESGRGDMSEEVRRILLPLSELADPGYPLEVEGSLMCWWSGETREMSLEDFHFTYAPHQVVPPVVRLYHLTARALSQPNRPVRGPIELECLQKGTDIAFLKAEVDTGTQPRPAPPPVVRSALRREVERPAEVPVRTSTDDALESYLRASLEQAVSEAPSTPQ